MSIYIYVLVMAVTTYLIRALPLTLFKKPIRSRFLRSFLHSVPPACLTAMTFPAILTATDHMLSGAVGLGVGVLLSAVPVFLIQGSLVLLAGLIAPLMSAGAINEMTCAGSLLIIMIGTNLMGITKIKVADFLPAILFAPVIYHLVPLFEMLYGIVM